jgi:hypothetical protein
MNPKRKGEMNYPFPQRKGRIVYICLLMAISSAGFGFQPDFGAKIFAQDTNKPARNNVFSRIPQLNPAP